MTDREVMQQALDALEAKGDAWIVLERKAIISLRAALAETTPEPYDYRFRYDRPCYKCKSAHCPANCKDTALEQQAEPVAWNAGVAPMWPQQKEGETFLVSYTTPPQRQWVGLTGQEKDMIARVSVDVFEAMYRVEAKLKERNNG